MVGAAPYPHPQPRVSAVQHLLAGDFPEPLTRMWFVVAVMGEYRHPPGKDTAMGLTRAALIFAAGYVVGRPEGRAKVAALAKRPAVTQLREQAQARLRAV